jgi:transcriptional regulator with XRE-family HTH domain
MGAARGSGDGGRGGERRPHEVDIHVGQRLRLRRTLLGLSQGELGRRVGLTFQQIQKYERGVNRIGASRLAEFAAVLGVPPGWFFEDMADAARQRTRLLRQGAGAEPLRELGGHDTLELVRLYNKVRDRRVRERILALLRAVALEGRMAS